MFSFHRANCSFPSMLPLALKVWLIITFLDIFLESAVLITVSKFSVKEKLSFVNATRGIHNLFWANFFTYLILKKIKILGQSTKLWVFVGKSLVFIVLWL